MKQIYSNTIFEVVQRYSLVWVACIIMNTNWGMEYDLNQTNVTHRKTILHWAAETSAVKLVDELFAAGVGFTLQDVYSEPPLHYAVESGHLETWSGWC